jgi:alkylglycerol monooxygenase
MELQIYIILAFVVLVVLEAAYLRLKRKPYALNVAVSNMSCGVVNLCTNLFYRVAFLYLYGVIQSRVGLLNVPTWHWSSLVFAFLAVDLVYYAYHRMSHRVAVLWGAHIVHHESDEYNLTVSLRQGSVALLVSAPFYLTLALLGVPLATFLVADGLYQLYQFFVHTGAVERMGWLENVLATPRLHRVHHARNPEYIDCNYSGFLILWDKMFDTYREPSVEPLYGVMEPLSSWSPLWANFGYFQTLFAKARMRRGWDRLWTWIAPPEWAPALETVHHHVYRPYDAKPRRDLFEVAVAMFLVSLGLAVIVAGPAKDWAVLSKMALVVLTVSSTLVATRLFDGWARR